MLEWAEFVVVDNGDNEHGVAVPLVIAGVDDDAEDDTAPGFTIPDSWISLTPSLSETEGAIVLGAE